LLIARWYVLLFALVAFPAHADKANDLKLARQGWVYELRTTMVGRDLSIPVSIHGRTMVEGGLCVVGTPPHALSRQIIDEFAGLLAHVFNTPFKAMFAGAEAHTCGAAHSAVLRLFGGYPPNGALSTDLDWLNRNFALGLPKGRQYMASSPAQAQTFFGRGGQATHLLVKQSEHKRLTPLEEAFFRSILIEELFQSFTFGMDILLFDRSAGFTSKLQEFPLVLDQLQWGSRAFMQKLLAANPTALCPFDVLMLHAIAEAPVDETTDPKFVTYITDNYERLQTLAVQTIAMPEFASIVDPGCRRVSL